MTDDELEQFDFDDASLEMKLQWHFDEKDLVTWQEVLQEGARVYGLLFDVEVKRGTPIHAVLTAVSSAARDVGKNEE